MAEPQAAPPAAEGNPITSAGADVKGLLAKQPAWVWWTVGIGAGTLLLTYLIFRQGNSGNATGTTAASTGGFPSHADTTAGSSADTSNQDLNDAILSAMNAQNGTLQQLLGKVGNTSPTASAPPVAPPPAPASNPVVTPLVPAPRPAPAPVPVAAAAPPAPGPANNPVQTVASWLRPAPRPLPLVVQHYPVTSAYGNPRAPRAY